MLKAMKVFKALFHTNSEHGKPARPKGRPE
jgi:hypothetical protein